MSVKVTTGLVRLSYAHLFTPTPNLNGELKYSSAIIVPKKSNTVGIITEKMEELLNDPETKRVLGKGRLSRELLRDGDEEKPDDDAYTGCYFFNANANPDHKPKVLDKDRQEIVDPDEVYSGCWAQAVISLYPYNKGGNKGIGAGLLAIRKIKDGERLSGSSVSDEDFDDSLLGGSQSSLEDLL